MTGTVSGIRAILAVRAALGEIGLARTSSYNGGEVLGWLPMNYWNASGFAVQPDAKSGGLRWFVTVSGKPHMQYREYDTVEGGDERVTLHEPTNPMVVEARMREAFESLDLRVDTIDCIGHQGMWDDDVHFRVETDTPVWIEAYDKSNRNAVPADGPRLMSVSIQPMPIPSRAELPAYELAAGRYGLTREAVDVLAAAVTGETRYDGQPAGTAEVEEDGVLHVTRPGRKTDPRMRGFASPLSSGSLGARIAPVEIVNHWGDAITVWPVPSDWVTPCPRYTTEIPVLVAGEEVIKPSFSVLDEQAGDDTPWRRPAPEVVPVRGPRP